MKKGIVSLIAWTLPFMLLAQTDTSHGINWAEGLTWEQIKQKAKDENKYIFVDAYATWCGPCKMMDKYVYPNDTVGSFFNEHFISVKAQMDVTDSDSKSVKDWHNDATTIRTEYMVNAYPSLIFLTSEGKIVQKEEGYRPIKKLVSLANSALAPEKVYNDPYNDYKMLVTEYNKGVKQYGKMPYMIRTAMKLSDKDFVTKLVKEYEDYWLADSNSARAFTKENIELWSSFQLSSKSIVFKTLYGNTDKIDSVMNEKGFAIGVIDQTIQFEIVDSFFRMQTGETTTITGKKIPNSEIMFIRLPSRKDGKIEPDNVETDWKKLQSMINGKFTAEDATRNVMQAKVRWYEKHQNMPAALKIRFFQLRKHPPSVFDGCTADQINTIAWLTFLYVTNEKLLKKAVKWMKMAVNKKPNDNALLDTYANLLYKTGRKKEAMQCEEKALNVTSPLDDGKLKTYRNVIAKMKEGKPTYKEEGAIWTK